MFEAQIRWPSLRFKICNHLEESKEWKDICEQTPAQQVGGEFFFSLNRNMAILSSSWGKITINWKELLGDRLYPCFPLKLNQNKDLIYTITLFFEISQACSQAAFHFKPQIIFVQTTSWERLHKSQA